MPTTEQARRPDRRSVVAGLVFGWASAAARGAGASEPLPPALVRPLEALITTHDVPALGFGVVRAGRVASVDAFGFADRERQVRATPDTAFLIASISKVVTATALMQLSERGLFALDDPIGPHLDFPVENPRHPGPITFRQVLDHTSSISDLHYIGFEVVGDPVLSLRDFLSGYLSPGGRWYGSTPCYLNAAPGARWAYCNVAFALAGYLAERIGGAPFQRQTAERIFRPLDMKPAAWSLADLGAAPVATPYVGVNGKLTPRAQIGYPDWPAGLLRTSTRSLTRFLAAHAGGGRLGGARILRPDTVRAMAELKPFDGTDGRSHLQGLSWEVLPGEGARLVAKGGGDPGALTLMAFDPATGNGAAILTNHTPSRALQTDMAQLIRLAVAV